MKTITATPPVFGPVELSLNTKETFVNQMLALNSDIENLKTSIALLKGKLSKLENTKLNMEKQATDFMSTSVVPNKSKYILETATHKLVVTTPSTCKVVVDDDKLIPKEYIRVKEEKSINKEKLKVDLKDGLEIPGAHLESSELKFSLVENGDDDV